MTSYSFLHQSVMFTSVYCSGVPSSRRKVLRSRSVWAALNTSAVTTSSRSRANSASVRFTRFRASNFLRKFCSSVALSRISGARRVLQINESIDQGLFDVVFYGLFWGHGLRRLLLCGPRIEGTRSYGAERERQIIKCVGINAHEGISSSVVWEWLCVGDNNRSNGYGRKACSRPCPCPRIRHHLSEQFSFTTAISTMMSTP